MKFFNFVIILIVSFFVFNNVILAKEPSNNIFSSSLEQGNSIDESATTGAVAIVSGVAQDNKKVEMTPSVRIISPTKNKKLEKVVDIQVQVENAQGVDFYIQRFDSQILIYLGSGAVADPYADKKLNIWHYSWNTLNTPNGEYDFFAEITNIYGSYKSELILVKVDNTIEKTVDSSYKKEQIGKISEQLQQKEEAIKKHTDEATKEIVQEVSTLVNTLAAEIGGESGGGQTKTQLDKEMGLTSETIDGTIKDLSANIKEEKQTKQEILKEQDKKILLEEQINKKEQEIKALEAAEPVEIMRERMEEIKQEKKEMLEQQQQQKEEIEKEVQEKEKKLLEIEAVKKANKNKIIEESLKPINKIGQQTEKFEDTAIRVESMTTKIQEKIANFEETIGREEETRAALTEEMIRDSDGDGLPDALEVELGSDPLNPDSDGDGYMDGEEAALGSDIMEPSKRNEVVYQDPRKVKPQKADIFTIEKVGIKKSEITNKSILRLEGNGLPNTFISIYIYSSLPIIVVTKVDANGRWIYELDKPLDPGQHEVYVVLTNNHGEITARSESFNFIKSGANILHLIPEVWAQETGKVAEDIASPYEILKRSFIILTLAIITLAIGVALLLVGILNKKELKMNISSLSPAIRDKKKGKIKKIKK
ncbi:hypothetical protein KJ562_00655 [Patescibacteria group bacterium]|nr:hypothetical protein [Patescibacteria group bacterium]